MALYTVASNRVTSNPENYIHGIMQFFRFQLDVPSSNTDAAAHFTLAEPELQLGQQLITQYPLMSQMHVRQSPVRRGGSAIPLESLDESRKSHSI